MWPAALTDNGEFLNVDTSNSFKKRKKNSIAVCGDAMDFYVEDVAGQMTFEVVTLCSTGGSPQYLIRFFKGDPKVEEFFTKCDDQVRFVKPFT